MTLRAHCSGCHRMDHVVNMIEVEDTGQIWWFHPECDRARRGVAVCGVCDGSGEVPVASSRPRGPAQDNQRSGGCGLCGRRPRIHDADALGCSGCQWFKPDVREGET